ncbi:EsV-1-110 [Ectocarpus siliculosus virus 1]|uniref:EsV-1-110 n=1 Tax=Ectocarpus siliculosus virus 1 (isolate New Zealand/Kaikoura/1988) TaxID=654926 RepID=Q8QNG8_ESV1K|nr:EsV-1-110 [Ectocarpus siliculosus virus 1]AAK14528.1 EsV-1-110 [Ectocarpus siliculosus virus 1]
MAIRSVDEIINLSDSSKNPEKLAYKDLVQHIDPRIRGRAPRHSSLHFKIPGILWGQPVFDADRVEKMIVHHYKRMGFQCVRLAKREILIQWGEGGQRDEEVGRHDSTEDSTESSDTDSADSTESSETGTSEGIKSTDSSDGEDSRENNTKCVTVEQIPLSKRLSAVNNQLQQNL